MLNITFFGLWISPNPSSHTYSIFEKFQMNSVKEDFCCKHCVIMVMALHFIFYFGADHADCLSNSVIVTLSVV